MVEKTSPVELAVAQAAAAVVATVVPLVAVAVALVGMLIVAVALVGALIVAVAVPHVYVAAAPALDFARIAFVLVAQKVVVVEQKLLADSYARASVLCFVELVASAVGAALYVAAVVAFLVEQAFASAADASTCQRAFAETDKADFALAVAERSLLHCKEVVETKQPPVQLKLAGMRSYYLAYFDPTMQMKMSPVLAYLSEKAMWHKETEQEG